MLRWPAALLRHPGEKLPYCLSILVFEVHLNERVVVSFADGDVLELFL